MEEIVVPASVFAQGSEHGIVRKALAARFGKKAVVCGVDRHSAPRQRRTFGVPVDQLGKNDLRDDDPLVYASEGDLVVYDPLFVERLPNSEYEILDAEKAILGRVRVVYR